METENPILLQGIQLSINTSNGIAPSILSLSFMLTIQLQKKKSILWLEIHQRKFQFKIGLPKIIKIPCHDVLANQNDLKLKKGALLKQLFNINLGIGIIKKLLFLFIFLTYLPMFFIITFFQVFVIFGIEGSVKSTPSGYLLDVEFNSTSSIQRALPMEI